MSLQKNLKPLTGDEAFFEAFQLIKDLYSTLEYVDSTYYKLPKQKVSEVQTKFWELAKQNELNQKLFTP